MALNTGSKVRQLRTGTLGTHGVLGGFEQKYKRDRIEFRYDGDVRFIHFLVRDQNIAHRVHRGRKTIVARGGEFRDLHHELEQIAD